MNLMNLMKRVGGCEALSKKNVRYFYFLGYTTLKLGSQRFIRFINSLYECFFTDLSDKFQKILIIL